MREFDLSDVTELDEAVQLAVGAASMCWADPAGAGVFDSDQATKVSEELIRFVRNLYKPDMRDMRLIKVPAGMVPEGCPVFDVTLLASSWDGKASNKDAEVYVRPEQLDEYAKRAAGYNPGKKIRD